MVAGRLSYHRLLALAGIVLLGIICLYQLSIWKFNSMEGCISRGMILETGRSEVDQRRIVVGFQALPIASQEPDSKRAIPENQVTGTNFHSKLSPQALFLNITTILPPSTFTSRPSCILPELHTITQLLPAVLNSSHTPTLFFALCTTPSRAMTLSRTWAHFLSRRRSGCLIVDSEGVKDEEGIRRANEIIQEEVGEHCKMVDSTRSLKMKDSYQARVLGLIKEAWEEAERKEIESGRETEWFVISDDDTWWVDIKSVKARLSYLDYKEDHLIGSYSDAVQNFRYFGPIAYGGAGIIISRALMEKMQPLLRTCVKKFHEYTGGDMMISHCAALAKDVNVKQVVEEFPGLSQMDMKGDSSGFLQSGNPFPFQTIHHWGNWLELIPGQGGRGHDQLDIIDLFKKGVDAIGGHNMLRRFVFDEGSVVWTSGYSVVVYETPLSEEDLEKVEMTWNEGTTPRKPSRSKLKEGTEKVSYFISSIEILTPTKTLFIHTCSSRKRAIKEILVIWDTTLPKVAYTLSW